MYKNIVITNRQLCENLFLEQINKIAKTKPDAIILREKDLNKKEYQALAMQVLEICSNNQVECILHHYVEVARELNCPNIHLSLIDFLKYRDRLSGFKQRGVSVHSLEEALLAQEEGATYLIAGHIFQTDCKKDLAPRGVAFLEELCQKVKIPVYAIGGLNEKNIPSVIEVGAKGICRMSFFMKLK
jgi:thiamine-phosphate pyrophosphorylase